MRFSTSGAVLLTIASNSARRIHLYDVRIPGLQFCITCIERSYRSSLNTVWAEYAGRASRNAVDVQIVGDICRCTAYFTSTLVIGGDLTNL